MILRSSSTTSFPRLTLHVFSDPVSRACCLAIVTITLNTSQVDIVKLHSSQQSFVCDSVGRFYTLIAIKWSIVVFVVCLCPRAAAGLWSKISFAGTNLNYFELCVQRMMPLPVISTPYLSNWQKWSGASEAGFLSQPISSIPMVVSSKLVPTADCF